MLGQTHRGPVLSWLLIGVLATVLGTLVLTFPSTGVSGCPSRAFLTTDVTVCSDNLLSWNGWVQFPYWEWLPWVYVAAILGVMTALAVVLRHALRAR